MTLPVFEQHDAAVATAIAATGLLVDVARKPDGAGWQGTEGESDFVVYAMVWPLPGGSRDGSSARPFDDVTLPYQVTCVADTATACRAVADLVETALVDAGVTVDDRFVEPIDPSDAGGGVRRDDDTAGPSLFYAAPRYEVTTRPN